MPSAIYEVYPPDLYPPEEVWARYWANCDIEREVALCGKRQVVSHILPILRTLDHPLIVDCGCGAGPWVLYLQRLGFENVIGVDNYVPALKKLDALGDRQRKAMSCIFLLMTNRWMSVFPSAWPSTFLRIQLPAFARWSVSLCRAGICS